MAVASTQFKVGPLKVGIQGVRACFHDVAARKYFSNDVVTPVECASFQSLAVALESRQADICIMAIENSIAGSILTNYTLMETHGFKIIGEVYLRIEMSLMAMPGQKISELKSVRSHPMALLQCADFLSAHPYLSVLEASDTAESAKLIAAQKQMGTAAIASDLAAEIYGLNLLEQGIESNKLNYTRFLVICREKDYHLPVGANKSSVCFETPDQPGSLLHVLEALAEKSVNMTKLQSVPILGRPYEYSFHVDLEWKDFDTYANALEKVRARVKRLVHFGDYCRGERPQS